MTLRIRPLENNDLPAIHRILIQEPVLPFHAGILPSTRVEAFQERMAKAGTDFHSFVAEADGAVIGWAALGIEPARLMTHGGTFSIAVDADHHGKGVGTALTAKILDLADNWLMLERVELGVLAINPRAQTLYERFGFGVIGRRTGAVRSAGRYVDMIVMERLRPGGVLAKGAGDFGTP